MEIAGLRVWTSQLKRTQQTAAAIKAQMESLDALNELEAVSENICLFMQAARKQIEA
jgi:broad specificity phosphatase PhoE